jgi:hypothetical protein
MIGVHYIQYRRVSLRNIAVRTKDREMYILLHLWRWDTKFEMQYSSSFSPIGPSYHHSFVKPELGGKFFLTCKAHFLLREAFIR